MFFFVQTQKKSKFKAGNPNQSLQFAIMRYSRTNNVEQVKGQLVSKCPFGVIVWKKNNNEIISGISALAFNKRSNQKSSIRESK